jgi:hypothetical protein
VLRSNHFSTLAVTDGGGQPCFTVQGWEWANGGAQVDRLCSPVGCFFLCFYAVFFYSRGWVGGWPASPAARRAPRTTADRRDGDDPVRALCGRRRAGAGQLRRGREPRPQQGTGLVGLGYIASSGPQDWPRPVV